MPVEVDHLAHEAELSRAMDAPLSSKNGVEVRHVSKRFRLNTEPMGRMSALFFHRFVSGVRRRDFWALQDVSFDIRKGEMLGILGVNGSGKSTMLRLITGISTPTAGEIRRLPRIAPLLDLSAGLHPALSGYENLFLNGSIIGITREEIRSMLPGIIEFSGLSHKFLEAPVRTYSAGMTARLGFSLAVAVDPDIILVDEVLAVGDLDFQMRSAQKILEFRDAGKAMVLVSHSSSVIQGLATDALWIHEGRVKTAGKSAEVVSAYNAYLTEQVRRQGRKEGLAAMEARISVRPHVVVFQQFITTDEQGRESRAFNTNGVLNLEFVLQGKDATSPVDLQVAIQFQTGVVVEEFAASERGFIPVVPGNEDCQVKITFDPLILLSGEYLVEITAFEAGNPDNVLGVSEAREFTIDCPFPNFDVYPAFIPAAFRVG